MQVQCGFRKLISQKYIGFGHRMIHDTIIHMINHQYVAHDNRFFDMNESNDAHQHHHQYHIPSYALVILNRPVVHNCINWLFHHSSIVVCADGGSNALYDSSVDESQRRSLVPAAIVGDLDSARPEVVQFYDDCGARIVQDCDENSNDLQKCVKYLCRQRREHGLQIDMLILYGAFGGRFDQEMAAVNALFLYTDKGKNDDDETPTTATFKRVLLFSEQNVGELLWPGRHRLLLNTQFEGPYCGLIPICGRLETVVTTGLKYNLNGETCGWGGLVSSSNSLANDVVEIETSDPLLWTTGRG